MASSSLIIVVVVAAAALGATAAPMTDPLWVVAPSTLEEAPYADWAHVHMVWSHNSLHNESSNIEWVEGFLSRNIRVGWFNIDSTWDASDEGRLGVGSFEFDPSRYPNPQAMLDYMRQTQGVRITLWQTSGINLQASTYEEACERGFFLNDCATVEWWRGVGSLFDFTNPEGLEWYHGLHKRILDMGVDGWKNDGIDPYVVLLQPKPVMGYGGRVTVDEYARDFYRDFYYYANENNGDKTALIMARPVDFFLSQPLVFAPIDVMWSGWVGDQDGDWLGLQQVLTYYTHSGWRNFTNFGSDIGGYRRSQSDPRDAFVRWTQLAAFTPFMENGGGGEHRPWLYDDELLSIYTIFVDIHYSLFDYLLFTGADSADREISAYRPLAEVNEAMIPTTWNYMLGDDIFVAPISNDTRVRFVDFPQPGEEWVYWLNESVVYDGGVSVDVAVPIEAFPAYRRAGAIIPLTVVYHADGLGFRNVPSLVHPIEELPITLSVANFAAAKNNREGETVRAAVRPTHGRALEASYTFTTATTAVFTVSAYTHRDVVLRLTHASLPLSVTQVRLNGDVLPLVSPEALHPSMPAVAQGEVPIWGDGNIALPHGTLYVALGKLELGAIVEIDF